jgi:iron(III) transport system substrate-binding protein
MTLRHWTMAAGALALAVTTGSANAALDEDWKTVLAKAKKEGLVVVHGAPGKRYRKVFLNGFRDAYPDIKIKFSGASNRVDLPKLLRERKAKIYTWDLWISGSGTAVGKMKPRGIFQPLEQILTKETMNDKHWKSGFHDGWMDVEKKFFYSFDGSVQNPIQVNWDIMKKSQLTSIKDLIKPEFAGKIVWDEPRLGGSGNGASLTIFKNFGEEFLRKLYAQKIVFTSNRRQVAEWVVRGRYPIGIGLGENDLKVFTKQGLGLNIKPLPRSYYKIQQISPGFGSIGFIDKAPHRYAAAVYINWLLSKKGQALWAQVPRNSRRTDVEPGERRLAPLAGVTYFNGQKEIFYKTRSRMQTIAKEVISAPLKKRKRRGKRGKRGKKKKSN